MTRQLFSKRKPLETGSGYDNSDWLHHVGGGRFQRQEIEILDILAAASGYGEGEGARMGGGESQRGGEKILKLCLGAVPINKIRGLKLTRTKSHPGHSGLAGQVGGSDPGVGGYGALSVGGGSSKKQQDYLDILRKKEPAWDELGGNIMEADRAGVVFRRAGIHTGGGWDKEFYIETGKRLYSASQDWLKEVDFTQLTKKSASGLIDDLKRGGAPKAFSRALKGENPAVFLNRVTGGTAQFRLYGKRGRVIPIDSKHWESTDWFE